MYELKKESTNSQIYPDLLYGIKNKSYLLKHYPTIINNKLICHNDNDLPSQT